MVKNPQQGPNQPAEIRCTFYGQLHFILDLTLHASRKLGLEPTHHLLAVIEPCATQGKDATQEMASYLDGDTTAKIVTDLETVECVCPQK